MLKRVLLCGVVLCIGFCSCSKPVENDTPHVKVLPLEAYIEDGGDIPYEVVLCGREALYVADEDSVLRPVVVIGAEA